MCSKSKCSKCQKVTYTGCGNHLSNVFSQCNQNQICTCKQTPQLKAYIQNRFGECVGSECPRK